MKTSLAWLNTYLDTPVEADEAIPALTHVGFPDDGAAIATLSNGQTDTCIDFEVTSNRGDCLCHVGLARELAAVSGRKLKAPHCDIPGDAQLGQPVTKITKVDNKAEGLCPVYTARVITGVKIAPSPDWLQHRLEAVGLRPVNNVVDITNFVLLELGQPLHAFDLDRLDGKRIVVRRARKNEAFTAIDGTKHKLADDMLVIADGSKPQAVAGVMGGLDSEVSDATTNILLESARFEPLNVRATSRRLKLSSDSSYRFERGVDPRGVERASKRAAQLILEIAGGTLADGVIRVGEPEPKPRELTMRVERCNKLLGLELTAQQQAEYLARLGLSPIVEKGVVKAFIPTFRLDLEREVDLIEEVARHYGLDKVPLHEKIASITHARQDKVVASQSVARVLTAHGYHETITPSLLDKASAEAFLPSFLTLLNVDAERRSADPYLRPSVLPSLLNCRKLNQDRGNDGVKLYEIAQAYGRYKGEPCENTSLAMLADAPDRGAALRELRGALEELVQAVGGPAGRDKLAIEPADDAHYEVAAKVMLGGEEIGRMGVLSAALQKQFDLQTPVVLMEVDVAVVLGLYPPARGTIALPKFPAIERDLSVIVGEAVRWAQIEASVAKAQPALLESVRFIMTYRGKPIPPGSKSVSFRLTFRDPGKTLRHDEVDPQVATVVERLGKAVGATLRG